MRPLTVAQHIISNTVEGLVCEDEEQDRDVCRFIRRPSISASDSTLHRDCPANVHQQQADGAHQEHWPPLELGHEHGDCDAADQTPAGAGDIDLLLEDRVRPANHL